MPLKSLPNWRTIHRYLLLAFCVALMFGLFASKAMLSISMISLSALFVLSPNVREDVRTFLRSPAYWMYTLLFLVFLVSFFWSSNHAYLLDRVRMKLPFLFMPPVFMMLRRLSLKDWQKLLFLYLCFTILFAGGVLINYLVHFQEITESIKIGKAIPAPVSHIRFSLMCLIGFLSAVLLLQNNFQWWKHGEKYFLLASGLFLAVFLHIYSVRTGLVGFYLALILLTFFYLLKNRKWLLGGLLLTVIIALPVLAYHVVEPFHNKVSYTIYDVKMFLSGQAYEGLSDSRRIATIIAGVEVGKENPVIGTGAGDVKTETDEIYATEFPFVPPGTIIHNQFVFVFAATGVVGLAIFFLLLIYPLVSRQRYQYWFFAVIQLVFTFSFLVEAGLEIQIGTALFLFFSLTGLVLADKMIYERDIEFRKSASS